MHKPRVLVLLCAVAMVAVLAIPGTAFAVLQNEYGMKYAGQDICTSCHEISFGETTHGRFAQVGADPSADYMWPAGRIGVGEQLLEAQVAFTLGAGTGLREYLVNNAVTPSGPDPVTYTNVAGTTRYETAVSASQNAFTSATTVIIARGDLFPDAMGGAALAGAAEGPVLLVAPNSVPAAVLAEIDRLGATEMYVLGSTAAVSASVFAQLDAAISGTPVRLGGANRYATGVLVANETIRLLGASYSGAAFMATGVNFPDALAASPIMYAKGMPLVLVSPTGAFTLSAGMTDVTILGGTTAVPTSAQTALGAKFVTRIAGDDRYSTAAAIAQYGVSLGLTWDGVGIATGETHPDALSGGPLLGSNNSVMLLTPTGYLSADAAAKLSANKGTIANLTFVGGTPAISTLTRNQVKAILTGTTTPVGDTNPFVVPSLEWDPALPDTWEMGPDGIEYEAYTCQPCHHLGAVSQGKKPTVGNFVSTSVTGTVNAWVTNPAGPTTSPEKYVAGSSIQCEVCHGTGSPAGTVGNHFGAFTSNVKILRGTQLLDSQVCGQCHGSYKAKSLYGYTPDQNINLFVTFRGYADVPTEASYTANPAAYKFFPNGQNKGDKHSYYTEWAMSGHSVRGALTPTSARASVYQKTGASHYNATTSSLDCAKCHTGEGYAVRKNLKIMEDFVPSNSNTGFMGQECVICHVPHNAGTENGMGVREPDATPTLLGITMTSICEDCHNYQLEMQGLPFPVFPSNPSTVSLSARAGDFLNHPTREIYNGVGMYEVADAGKFMPGVKCEECHMPATKSDFPDKTGLERYTNQSWKRYSHRMFIMEPGKAEAWGLAPWGDSCSPCHAGETQAGLQEYIETWQADTAAVAANAKTAYEAAWAIKDATAGSGDMRLLARARVNYKNYTGEGSMGAHNPEYITDGLNAATKMAKSVSGEFAFVAGGTASADLDYIVGTVHNGDGTGAADATIIITQNGIDYEVTADANGNFSFLYMRADGAPTSIKWERCSDPIADILWVD